MTRALPFRALHRKVQLGIDAEANSILKRAALLFVAKPLGHSFGGPFSLKMSLRGTALWGPTG